jgi:hypothetical protein
MRALDSQNIFLRIFWGAILVLNLEGGQSFVPWQHQSLHDDPPAARYSANLLLALQIIFIIF